MLEEARRDKTKINFLTVINTTWVVEEIRPEKISGLYKQDLNPWPRAVILVQRSSNWANVGQLRAGHYVGSK